jgi:hypothetical protein
MYFEKIHPIPFLVLIMFYIANIKQKILIIYIIVLYTDRQYVRLEFFNNKVNKNCFD